MSLAYLFLENRFHPPASLSQHLEQKDTGFHTATSNIFPPYSKLLLLRVWSQDGLELVGHPEAGVHLDPGNLNVNFEHSQVTHVHTKV